MSFEQIAGFLIILVSAIGLVFISVVAKFIGLWFQAFVSGARIPLINILGMSLRKIPPKFIVNALINLTKAGIKDVNTNDLETHFLAGGRVTEVVRAVIAAAAAVSER